MWLSLEMGCQYRICAGFQILSTQKVCILLFLMQNLLFSLSYVGIFATPQTAARQASLSFTISQSLFKPTSIEPLMPFNHLILFHRLFLMPLSFPASGSFPMSWLFTSGGQSSGASASASVLSMNIQGWLPLGRTGLTSSLSKGLSNLLQHHSSKASTPQCSIFFMVQLSHPHMTTV